MKANTVEAHQFTALSCITVVIYGLISISCTHEPCKICLTKTKKNDKSKTPRPVGKKFVTARRKNHPKMGFDTHQQILQYFEIEPKYCKTQHYLRYHSTPLQVIHLCIW